MLAAEIAPRVLASPEGERVLTDLRHLGELLELASAEHQGPHALLAWLKRQRQVTGGSEADVDARRMRLESDARRVQVMTVHAAKGLEFGVVFLPLAFRHGLNDEWRKAPLVRVSDPGAQVGRLDVPGAVAARAAQLESDERFRLFYVAVTRAVHACVVYDAPAPQKMTEIPFTVLVARHRKPAPADAASASAATPAERKGAPVTGTFVITGPDRIRNDAAAAATRSASAKSTSVAEPVPAKGEGGHPSIEGVEWCAGLPKRATLAVAREDATVRVARPMPAPAPGPRPGRHSFTSLAHAAPRDAFEAIAAESPAEDEADAGSGLSTVGEVGAESAHAVAGTVEGDAHPLLEGLASVGGAGFGNAVHAVLEHRAPGRRIVDQLDAVRRALGEHGVADGRGPVDVAGLAAMLDRALAVPLWPGGPGVGDLPPRDQRAEFDFVLPLPRLRMAALRRVATEQGEPDLVPASDAEVAGLLRGKIDLVLRHEGRYRALDWKTNRLGIRVAEYAGAALDRAMDRDRYRFQALIYTLALHRHLRTRLRGYDRARHLGDPVYVFVRGAGLAPGAGVWSRPFAPALLDAVDALLDGREPKEAAA